MSVTKLQDSSYGVDVTVIVAKGKEVKNTWYMSDNNRNCCQRNSCALSYK